MGVEQAGGGRSVGWGRVEDDGNGRDRWGEEGLAGAGGAGGVGGWERRGHGGAKWSRVGSEYSRLAGWAS